MEGYGLKLCAVLEYADSRKIGNRLGDDGVDDARSCVHTLGELADALEVNDLSKGGAVFEQLSADGAEVGGSVSDREVGKCGAASKGAVANGENTCGDGHVIELDAALEGAVADGNDGAGNDNGFKI